MFLGFRAGPERLDGVSERPAGEQVGVRIMERAGARAQQSEVHGVPGDEAVVLTSGVQRPVSSLTGGAGASRVTVSASRQTNWSSSMT